MTESTESTEAAGAPDPQDVVEAPDYTPEPDPTGQEVQPGDPSYVEPMGSVSMNLSPITPGDGEVTA